jgi:adenosine deaminase
MLPAADVEGLQEAFRFKDFSTFIQLYLQVSDLLRTPEDFALIVEACGADMAAQNIRYREVTFTPYTHTHFQDKKLQIDDLLEGLDAGREAARRRYGVEMRWVFDVPRNLAFRNHGQRYDPSSSQCTLQYALLGMAHGVVGFGLGGSEVGAPPEPFAPETRIARAAGLLIVPHAGETMGPSSVWGVINELHADRIGHGVRSIEDPVLLTLLRDRQIPLEVSPSSNVCLGVYPSLAQHPFPHLDRMGLNLTINSDDPALFNTSLVEEYQRVAETFGYSLEEMARFARNAFVVCGAPQTLKNAWLSDLTTWLESVTNDVASEREAISL